MRHMPRAAEHSADELCPCLSTTNELNSMLKCHVGAQSQGERAGLCWTTSQNNPRSSDLFHNQVDPTHMTISARPGDLLQQLQVISASLLGTWGQQLPRTFAPHSVAALRGTLKPTTLLGLLGHPAIPRVVLKSREPRSKQNHVKN